MFTSIWFGEALRIVQDYYDSKRMFIFPPRAEMGLAEMNYGDGNLGKAGDDFNGLDSSRSGSDETAGADE